MQRGITLDLKKIQWIGFGKGHWGPMELHEEWKSCRDEIRILEYWFGRTGRSMKECIEYWLGRGEGVGRRIVAISKRLGLRGGIGAWEVIRLVQSTYFAIVYYGLEFVTNKKLAGSIQIAVNKALWSIT
ncbi:hypothetical protein C7212DRAFT_306306 [Tuber magnatum]|uniref:Uncharacterized protein n=1 Tax=Tuber magnatum TaxID=42249 RepID=A0A317T3B9_9PEZI|nr:hypothetical protein C7212DRAFT_306306 [Tuber magnatum]